ncbi:TPA: AAA family ATPase [Legionella pneumophila]|nr:AAA family ATPase [Legionella pneumophila]HEN4769617.1 replicative DNA helicase [Legionella pneumophila]
MIETESTASMEESLFNNIKIKSHLVNVIEKFDEMYGASDPCSGLTTGLGDFDEITGGLHPCDLIVIAGRPSMGKTTLAMNIVEHVAFQCGKAAIFFSLESTPETLALRFMSSIGRVNSHLLRTAQIEDEDWPRVTTAVQLLSEAPIYIDNVLGETISSICEKTHEISESCEDIGIVVIDYIQLLCCSGSSPENRTAELSAIIRQLKILAKELNATVIAISQLNRSLEQRYDKRPIMSDLRDSGSIEDDADMICFIYRDEYYNQDSPDSGTAELIVAKHRNGPIGKIRTAYIDKYNRFEELKFFPD